MSFRRPKSDQHVQDREWRDWLARNGPRLKALGFPPEVILSRDHWVDFLENGWLERFPESYTGFTFDRLSTDQMRGLLQVLESSKEFNGSSMSGWIRHRLGKSRDHH